MPTNKASLNSKCATVEAVSCRVQEVAIAHQAIARRSLLLPFCSASPPGLCRGRVRPRRSARKCCEFGHESFRYPADEWPGNWGR